MSVLSRLKIPYLVNYMDKNSKQIDGPSCVVKIGIDD